MSVNWNRDAAAHLYRRAGFGGTPSEIDALFAKGLDGAVSSHNWRQLTFTRLPFTLPFPRYRPAN